MTAATRGLVVACSTCQARPGQRCVSRNGVVRKDTHLPRFRAALHGNPVRDYFNERTEWRRSA